MKDFKNEFTKFANKIIRKENFTLLRYGDGEVYLMRGQAIGQGTQAYIMDGWSCDAKPYRLGEDLIKAAQLDDPRVFYGVPAPSQRFGEYLYLKELAKVPEENFTFADIWVNSNYRAFKKIILEGNIDPVVLIANEEIQKNIHDKMLGSLKIASFLGVPSDCANFYETNKEVLCSLLDMYKDYNNTVFFVSAGPMAEAIIYYLFINNPNNIYIDVGSAIDELGKKRITRGYIGDNDSHSNYTPNWNWQISRV